MGLVNSLVNKLPKKQPYKRGINFIQKSWRITFASYLLSLSGSTFELIYYCIIISGFIFALGWVMFFNDTFVSILAGAFFIRLMYNMFSYRKMFYDRKNSS